jgi:hypothetical protein
MPAERLVRHLRDNADALFLVMDDVGLNSRISFPSKLVDYSATGLPIVVCAPRNSAPAYWVHDHPGAGMFVEARDDSALHDAFALLANDAGRRRSLGMEALAVGNAQFAYARVRDKFFAALVGSSGTER